LDCFPFPTLFNGSGIFVGVAILTIFFILDALVVVVDFPISFINDCLLLLQAIDVIKSPPEA
jgi:hypothetical protein